MASEADLMQKLRDLQKQLGKRQMFEEAVSSIKSLLRQTYSSASPSLRNLFYSVICRVATILRTRYTMPGFWIAGLGLFMEAESLVSESSEREHLRSCIAEAREQLREVENQSEVPESGQSNSSRGFLFDGHLTVDPEPPQPQWLVPSNLMTTVANLLAAESSQGQLENNTTQESAGNLFQELINSLDNAVPWILDDGSVAPRVPPASKAVVAKLPVITVTEEILVKLGADAECAICKENLIVDDKMQELPCSHKFHPPCLKPWLDEHNSCPICRHELLTDDHKYESWKEREKEAEKERKGAANAVRGGEYMYV
ncbi:E3 ubiquitin-protein ligase AIP2 [Actinidia eriantha]|uniref:E3 ubiquitin-protein ligase AIP2 n=1 Tax=Actinidia eriantha TaxID=165200 RepID=UPI00258815BA|nr:E3 ubiquitin-protein ligase AIP2 [Actinidia eriantha]